MAEEMIDFEKIEKKWQKKWEKEKAFEVNEKNKKPKYYVLEQYPYPSGSGLHMGHTFVYTIGDIHARLKRMQGFNVLHPMGYDSFGLPAENAAIKAKSHPKKFTDEAVKNFEKQQRALGLSYDWTRKLESHDPEYYRWDQWIFLKMLERGLAYRKKASVNWCEKCNTVLANEQVIGGKCWRHEDTDVQVKNLEQWFLKITDYASELYDNLDNLDGWPEMIKKLQKNWIGKSQGTQVVFEIAAEKKKSNVIIVHGSNDSEKESKEGKRENLRHWYSWLKNRLEKNKVKTSNDLYPEDWNPDYAKWKEVFEGNQINKNTILVGHSIGAAFILRWLKENKRKVDKVILVAPYITKSDEFKHLDSMCDFDYDSSLKNYFNELSIIHSDDEKEEMISLKEIHNKLGGELIYLKDKGHFIFEDTKTEEFPELLEQINKGKKWKVFTTRPDTLFGVTFLVVSAQHPELMSLVTENKKEEVEKFAKKQKSVSEEDLAGLEKEGIFTGSYAIHPLTNEKIPIWTGNFVVADYGSGMVMAVPAHDQRDFEFAKKYHLPIRQVIKSEEANVKKQAYTGHGTLIHSEEFNGLKNHEAKEKITSALQEKNKGKKTLKFRLRDWLISRQRFWGTPIPIIYCEECGAVPVPEKDLPIKLPEDVKFEGVENPLTKHEKFLKANCPNCGKIGRRETDTMDTFVNSSWYFLRFLDSKNKKEIFDPKKADYWMPIDVYIGGKEHACLHDIYFRFYTKFLRDIGLLKFDEPAKRLFNQGFIQGPDGRKMSKSYGNVVLPEDASKKFGVDGTRMFLVSVASPENDFNWSDEGANGALNFVLRVINFAENFKPKKLTPLQESKLNRTIRDYTSDLENFKYNLAVIKLRELFFQLEEGCDKKSLEIFLKLLAPICPHIGEELWSKLGHKSLISLEKWPEFDEKRIDDKLEQSAAQAEKVVDDLRNIIKILKEKSGKEAKKAFIYVIPNEIQNYDEKKIEARTQLEVKIFSVTDKDKYDPEKKSSKARPGKPGIYIE